MSLSYEYVCTLMHALVSYRLIDRFVKNIKRIVLDMHAWSKFMASLLSTWMFV